MLTRSTRRKVAGLLGVLFALGLASAARAASGDAAAQEDALKKLGLSRAGDFYLLEADAEARSKIDEAYQAFQAYRKAEIQRASTVSPQQYQAALNNLQQQINQYKNQINATNRQINSLPRGRRGYSNNLVAESRAEATMYRNELQLEMNQMNQLLGQLKKNPPSPQQKAQAEADARDARDALEKAVTEARGAVDAVREKYETLQSNSEVKAALEVLGRGQKIKPKLGPSHTFTSSVKRLEKLERLVGAAPAESAKSKHTRSSRSLRSLRGTSTSTAEPKQP